MKTLPKGLNSPALSIIINHMGEVNEEQVTKDLDEMVGYLIEMEKQMQKLAIKLTNIIKEIKQ